MYSKATIEVRILVELSSAGESGIMRLEPGIRAIEYAGGRVGITVVNSHYTSDLVAEAAVPLLTPSVQLRSMRSANPKQQRMLGAEQRDRLHRKPPNYRWVRGCVRTLAHRKGVGAPSRETGKVRRGRVILFPNPVTVNGTGVLAPHTFLPSRMSRKTL